MAKLLKFPSADFVPPDKEDDDAVRSVLQDVINDADNIESVLVVGVRSDNRICWGTSSTDILQALWLTKAAERILMDYSLGGIDDG